KPEDARPTLTALAGAGFATEATNENWLYKATRHGVLVDVLFKTKGDIYLDDQMLQRSTIRTFRGQPVRVIAPEDLVMIKAIVHDEETPRHWHDALGVLTTARIDWEYLLERGRKGPHRLLSLLFYAESLGLVVPHTSLRRLTDTVLLTRAGDEL